MNLNNDSQDFVTTDSEKKKKKRYGKKRQKRKDESSADRNQRKKESSSNDLGVNTFKFPGILELDLNQEQSMRVNTLLLNLKNGSNVIHSTPLLKQYGEKFIIDKWNKIFHNNKYKINKVLLDIEMEQLKKIGPRSIALKWDLRKDSIIDNFERHDREYNIIDSTPKGVELKSLNPLSLANSIDKLKNSTSSGLPFLTKKGKVKDFMFTEFETLLKRKDPALLFTRTQEQLKTRTVWGFPIADTINEMMYYSPLLNVQRQLSWRAALNTYDDIDRAVTKILKHAKSNDKTIVSIDFSAYDSSVSPKLQSDGFKYIKELYGDKYSDDIDYINERFTTIGLVTPDGVFHGKHGVPSGSVFTNEIDSIVQFLIAKQSGVIDPELTQIQGDDGIYSVNIKDVDRLFKEFSNAGLTVNKSKSVTNSDYCTYLQNLYHIDYENNGVVHGIYPIYRAINRLLYQERFANLDDMGISGSDYYSIRAISILEGCRYHPMFEELVNFVYKLDKYKLNPTVDGINKFTKMRINSTGQEGLIINRPGDTSKGINNFETVKILTNLRLRDLKIIQSSIERVSKNKNYESVKLFKMLNNLIDAVDDGKNKIKLDRDKSILDYEMLSEEFND